jgi:hypothetical protein
VRILDAYLVFTVGYSNACLIVGFLAHCKAEVRAYLRRFNREEDT